VSDQAADLAAKRGELLREVIPGLRRLAIPAAISTATKSSALWTRQRGADRFTQIGIANRQSRVAQVQSGGNALKEYAALLWRQDASGSHDNSKLVVA